MLVISDLGAGGAQRVLSMLATCWSQQGYAVQVITFYGKERDHFTLPIETGEREGVGRIVLGDPGISGNVLSGLLANLLRVWRLRKALRQSNAPVVISFVAVTNVLTILAGMGSNWKTVISERNDPRRQSLGPLWDTLRVWLYRHADLVTANSSGAIETLAGYVPRQKPALVHNPVNYPATSVPHTSRKQIILAVGRLVPQKAFDVLLDAYALARESASKSLQGWRLVIVGDGPLAAPLREQAVRLGISDHVEWAGLVRDCQPRYREAGMFVLPSRFEGVPNALLEAMVCGCPVIVSDGSSGPLDYVENGTSGLVVPVGDKARLLEAMGALAGDRALRDRLGDSARARLAGNRCEHVAHQWRELVGLPELPENTGP